MFKPALPALFALPLLLPTSAQDSQPAPETNAEAPAAASPEVPEITPLPEGVAARATDEDGSATLLTYDELDTVLVARHGIRPEGKDVLVRLLNTKVLKKLALDAGIEISSKAVDARIAELDAKLLADGYEGGLAAQLVRSDVDPAVFRDTLAVSLAIEELTRLALELPEGERPGNGQQEAWMAETMKARGGSFNTKPFPTEDDAIVGSSGDVVVTMGELKRHLREELPRAFVEQSATQLILEKRLRAEAGEVDAADWKVAIDLELERRRARHNAIPQNQGVSYEALLDAQGLSLEKIAQDPAVVVTALTSVLAWREEEKVAREAGSTETDPEKLRDAGRRILYEREQDKYDGYYGERLHILACLLRAVEVPNELVSRSIEEAHAYLGRLAPGIPDEEGFKLIVGKLSDDAGAKDTGGELGWFGRGDTRLPAEVRDAAFAAWDANPRAGVAGPVDVEGGVALLWVGPLEPAPAWERMSTAVQSETQARILNHAMPTGGIQIFRDPPLGLPGASEGPAPEAEPASE
jgi:hypothetical protein